ncbi:MAG TPA: fumarylacetoacetase [Streptosporangiaceae bacterium]|nr:fumarylacetoacetase [Streptosporangiaceae bacterium]
MAATTWVRVPEGSGFGVQNLPYGIFAPPGEPARVGVAIGDRVLDLAGLAAAGLLPGEPAWFAAASLNPFMAAGPPAWQPARERLTELLSGPGHRDRVTPHLLPQASVELRLPFDVADYVDFYSSREHATRVGEIFRPGAPPLARNWLHLPAGYHGRAGSVMVSGTAVTRPSGQYLPRGAAAPVYGPTQRLDFEAEVGFVTGAGTVPGQRVSAGEFAEHAFGFVLVNDWSARDIQSWETQPLGPFLGKSFATSVSPWVVPLAALAAARVPPPAQDPPPLAYLRCPEPWGLDLSLTITLNEDIVARPAFRHMYWTPPQQLAHATVNGAPLRTGDLFASGTVSGPGEERGCLLELTWDGKQPVRLPGGATRSYLADGDVVRITATAPGADGAVIGFGAVEGQVVGG